MKNADKMNYLYKIGFALMLVCLALFAAAIVFMLLIENLALGVALAVAGAVLCLIAIILTMLSKPKPPKPPKDAAVEKETDNAEF